MSKNSKENKVFKFKNGDLIRRNKHHLYFSQDKQIASMLDFHTIYSVNRCFDLHGIEMVSFLENDEEVQYSADFFEKFKKCRTLHPGRLSKLETDLTIIGKAIVPSLKDLSINELGLEMQIDKFLEQNNANPLHGGAILVSNNSFRTIFKASDARYDFTELYFPENDNRIRCVSLNGLVYHKLIVVPVFDMNDDEILYLNN